MTNEPAPVPAPRVVSLYNAANALTVIRIVLVPVFLAFVVASEMTDTDWRIAACLAFCVASATDFVDGWIARRWSLVTSFGKVADPIADKALTGTALVLLSAYDHLPWWVTIAILVREWGVTALRFWVIRYGIIPASRGGKLKTGLQIVAIAWYLWPVPEPFQWIGVVLMGAALVVTVVTGVAYLVEALRMRAAAQR
ncbi:CDP-diacylglycerol--glycerol-3-phosphate 3-phosphatidyltransferase [Actinoplanes lutulentus]|uniref:CDP-diacylglycerol--glycerol-3-phosphate 3-phosphatidyltransferase n=1 Tax=Actinoplanes lutulentus TaxID=1287878 RepID=A0A327Z6W8_9ACTN|nr:CDP-diacylglycerol--glycerol-3-phosphate 3-phosphatidyltransferase [Actinoplanes lutulentus]MBB2942304.1 CDP-diacylglycerol--glycerol-3-phosphate 3-phosphatidyltransferase [Actinoplanes lutulentus]RAK33074.1 CDP-diacylglycerol--glycerol-3-phosphate 3-phosphatidyltransferase [Actinoplanes lutulentus]